MYRQLSQSNRVKIDCRSLLMINIIRTNKVFNRTKNGGVLAGLDEENDTGENKHLRDG